MPARLEEPRLVHSGYRGVRLTEADAVDGRRLSLEARWNQTDADWRFLLKEGYGVGFEDHHGQLVASAVLLPRSEEHTSELQSPDHLVCRLLLEKKKRFRRSNDLSSYID